MKRERGGRKQPLFSPCLFFRSSSLLLSPLLPFSEGYMGTSFADLGKSHSHISSSQGQKKVLKHLSAFKTSKKRGHKSSNSLPHLGGRGEERGGGMAGERKKRR